jgi:hypothetical protein
MLSFAQSRRQAEWGNYQAGLPSRVTRDADVQYLKLPLVRLLSTVDES